MAGRSGGVPSLIPKIFGPFLRDDSSAISAPSNPRQLQQRDPFDIPAERAPMKRPQRWKGWRGSNGRGGNAGERQRRQGRQGRQGSSSGSGGKGGSAADGAARQGSH